MTWQYHLQEFLEKINLPSASAMMTSILGEILEMRMDGRDVERNLEIVKAIHFWMEEWCLKIHAFQLHLPVTFM